MYYLEKIVCMNHDIEDLNTNSLSKEQKKLLGEWGLGLMQRKNIKNNSNFKTTWLIRYNKRAIKRFSRHAEANKLKSETAIEKYYTDAYRIISEMDKKAVACSEILIHATKLTRDFNNSVYDYITNGNLDATVTLFNILLKQSSLLTNLGDQIIKKAEFEESLKSLIYKKYNLNEDKGKLIKSIIIDLVFLKLGHIHFETIKTLIEILPNRTLHGMLLARLLRTRGNAYVKSGTDLFSKLQKIHDNVLMQTK